jgi:tetratricopeptide (TPR) repeat protein
MFEQAIDLDPNFAQAHAGYGNLCGLNYEIRDQNRKWIERGLAACDRAMALAPDLPEVLIARARMFHAQDKYAEAAQLAERAIECNGDDYNTYIPFDQSLERLGRKKEAEDVRERMTRVLRQQLELVPEDVRARILLATNLAYHVQDADEAIRHLKTAVALRPNDPNTLYNAACTYGVLARKSEALDAIKKAFASGYGNESWAANDSDLDCLHDEPEIRKLVGLDLPPKT